jgi:hypothetical protein
MDTSVNRDRKRAVQLEATKDIKGISMKFPKILDGTIVTLCGENPNHAIKYFNQFNIFKKCICVEYDADIFKKAKYTYNNKKKNVFFRCDDIFNVINNNIKDITGIDYDFECTFNNNTVKSILSNILKLNKESNKNLIWVRITTSHRRIKARDLKTKQNLAKILIEKYTDFSVTNIFNKNYRDTSPMNVWQFILERKNK